MNSSGRSSKRSLGRRSRSSLVGKSSRSCHSHLTQLNPFIVLLMNVGDSQDPISVMSLIDFAIFFAGCPVVWLSKLQSEVALKRDTLPSLNPDVIL